MTLNRLWAACLLVPAALLLDSSPASASPNGQDAPQAAAVTRRPLPKGVRQTRDGRYVREICDGVQSHCLARQALPADYVPFVSPIGWPRAEALTTTPQSDGLGPSQISAAYNLSTLPPATGTIVAVIDSPDYYAATDLAGYRAGYGLPALPTCPAGTNGGLPIPGGTPCFASVDEQGKVFTPTKAEDTPDGSDFETALDMDMVSAVCPACSIVLVQTTGGLDGDAGSQWADIIAAVQSAATIGAKSISISLGFPENTDPLVSGPTGTHDPIGYSTQGHLVFAASGDFGYDNETLCGVQFPDGGCQNETLTTPSYPASAPDVIAVGGTTMINLNNAGNFTESVWNDGDPSSQDVTTSGCSTEFAALSWQTANTKLSTTSCKMRANADVSAVAAYRTTASAPLIPTANTGIVIYSTSAPNAGINGFSGGIEGTSAASPLVAALFARIGLSDVMTASLSSDSLGWPYLPANTGAFKDITTGTDDVDSNDGGGVTVAGYQFPPQCTGSNLLLCQAGPGWDGPTGVGTPNGGKLLALLGGTPVSADGGVDLGLDGSAPGGDGGGSTSDGGANNDNGGGSSGCSCATVGGNQAGGLGAVGFLLGLTALVSRAARRRRSS